MKVIDTVNKTELDLTAEELVDLVANHNRQVDLIFAEPRTDEDGYLKWTASGSSAATSSRAGPSATTAATTSTTWPATSCPRRPRRSGWDRPTREAPFCC